MWVLIHPNRLLISINMRMCTKGAQSNKLLTQKEYKKKIINEGINNKREAVPDQSCQPFDLSRAEPAVMLLRLSFSSFWSEIKRWLKCSSGFWSFWYADCNYCVNKGIKHDWNSWEEESKTFFTKKKKKSIMHFDLCDQIKIFGVKKKRQWEDNQRKAVQISTSVWCSAHCELSWACCCCWWGRSKCFYLHRHWKGRQPENQEGNDYDMHPKLISLFCKMLIV